MTAETVFSIANMMALGGWIVLAAVPHRRWSNLVAVTAVASLLSVAYVVLVAAFWVGSRGGFSSLANVAALFENPWLLLAGWTHYLAFDLLVGGWEARDASRRAIPRLLLLPCLVLTFLFGPAGWILYMGIRSLAKPRLTAPAS